MRTMPEENAPADPALPTNLRGLDPGELLARGLQSARISGGAVQGWTPPTLEEVAPLFPHYEILSVLGREAPQGAFDLPSARTGCDARLDAIVLKAMQQAPERRYQSTQEMKADVETARTPRPAPPTPAAASYVPRHPRPRVVAVAKKSRGPRWFAATAALVVLAGAAFFLEKNRGKNAGGGAAKTAGNATIATATKERPYVNSLGMKFVPVPITGGPTAGQRVLFSIWETRVQDYQVFVRETERMWPPPGIEQTPTHPAVMMNWPDAQAFCLWLTGRERRAGRLPATQCYRLPADHEWSCTVGLGAREDPAQTPKAKSGKIPGVFPWGSAWPPPAGAGNFADGLGAANDPGHAIRSYSDGFAGTAPVASFAPDERGSLRPQRQRVGMVRRPGRAGADRRGAPRRLLARCES